MRVPRRLLFSPKSAILFHQKMMSSQSVQRNSLPMDHSRGTGESNLMRRSGASTYIRLPKIRGQCLPTEIRLAFVWGCSLQPRHSAWASCMESPPLLYVERIDPELIQRLGISKEKASQPDVYLRIPVYKESVFRAAVEQKGLPVSDVLQIWLDVSNHSSRGKEQADRLREQILEPPLSNK
jgi:hypothetical protein